MKDHDSANVSLNSNIASPRTVSHVVNVPDVLQLNLNQSLQNIVVS